MKIGFLNQPWDYGAPPQLRGSMERWVWEVSRRLARSCEVVVFGSTGGNEKATDRHEGVEFIGVPVKSDRWLLTMMQEVWRWRDPRRRAIASNLYYRFYALRAASAFRDRGSDVVHIQNFSQFVPLVRRLVPHARIVLHMHASWLAQLDRSSLEPRLSQTDAIVGNSEYVTTAIRERYPDRAHRCDTVFNGVDANLFYPPAKRAFRSEQDVIVYVGRLSPEKGIHVLLDAFDRVLAFRPNARLELIGGSYVAPIDFIVNVDDDPSVKKLNRFYGKEGYHEFVQRRIRMGLETKVTCVGNLPHEQVADHLRRATLFVAPSLVETFGMPVAEAMATALPVVASRVGALPELIEDKKTGLLVNPDDSSALADAILRLLRDRRSAQELGKAARLRALQLFSWDSSAEKLRRLYARLCDMDASPADGGLCVNGTEGNVPGYGRAKEAVTAPRPAQIPAGSSVQATVVGRR